LVVQAAFCFFVLYSHMIIPGFLTALGLYTLTNRKEDAAAETETAAVGTSGRNKATDGGSRTTGGERGTHGGASYRARAARVDAGWLQCVLEAAAVRLEHAVAVTAWADPVVTGAFVAACGGVSHARYALSPQPGSVSSRCPLNPQP
jgi:hypothetical protein